MSSPLVSDGLISCSADRRSANEPLIRLQPTSVSVDVFWDFNVLLLLFGISVAVAAAVLIC